LAEALQFGCKVLCSDIPVLREVGGSHCRYFSLDAPSPAAELATSIAAVLNGSEPQSNATHRFATDQITPHYVALYRSLLSGASQPNVDDLPEEGVFRSEKYAV
jgi:hypothetical protein